MITLSSTFAAQPLRATSPLRASLTVLALSACTAATQVGAQPQQTTAPQVASAAPVDPDAWRRERPGDGPASPLHVPAAHKKQLANGLTIISVPKSELPLVRVAVVLKTGSGQDPAEAAGLAALMADVLKMGTRTRTAQGIADAIETAGSGIEVSVDEDATMIATSVLRENLEPVLDVLADILRHPTFAVHELERARKLRLNTLSQLENAPVHAARNAFRKAVYGGHPYGHMPVGSAAALHKLGHRDLQAFYAAHVRPANMAVVVVGAMSTSEAEAQIDARLGDWHGARDMQSPPAAPESRPSQLMLVPRPGAPQSQLMVGELGVQRQSPDYYPHVLCNAVLGGMFNSRLNMNLREDKGWTYGARSAFNFMRARGLFYISTSVRTDVTGPAIQEIFKEVSTLRNNDVSTEELQNAKNWYSLSLPSSFQTVEGMADMVANLFVYDLPDDYYQRLPENLATVTVADVRRVATQYLHPDAMSIVVVGDPDHVKPALAQLGHGAVMQLDAQGQPLQTKP
jgi:zinc protease